MKLIGNQKIKENLEKIVQENKISHSYMFVGTKGIGKKLFAKEFAKAILCQNDEKKPCLQCQSCLEFDHFNHPDYKEITLADEKNSIKIDTIRQMQRKLQELPIVAKRKVYVIDNSETMTKEAQNCLLKTLEEPPSFVTIILIVADENKLLSTIQSRCIKMYFQNLSQEEIEVYMQENQEEYQFSDTMLLACGGSIEKIKQIIENKELYITIEELFNHIENMSLIDLMPKAEILYKNKDDIQNLLEYMNILFLQKAKENRKYIEYIKFVEEAKKDLLGNANYDMTVDRLLFRISEYK